MRLEHLLTKEPKNEERLCDGVMDVVATRAGETIVGAVSGFAYCEPTPTRREDIHVFKWGSIRR